jgi:hypothetical protein
MAIKCEFTVEEIDLLIKTLSNSLDWMTNDKIGDLVSYLNNRRDKGKLPPCGHDSCRG